MKIGLLVWWLTLATGCAQVKFVFTNWVGSGSSGSGDGIGPAASFAGPFSLGAGSNDSFYIGDYFNQTIRLMTAAKVVTTVAGTAPSAGTNDGTGAAARFYRPDGVVMDSSGNVFVADTGNFSIRKIAPGGVVTTFAGSSTQLGTNDGIGGGARFYLLAGLAIDKANNLYVADRYNSTIRKITPAQVVTTIAGLGGAAAPGTNDGFGSAARFNFPTCLAFDAATNLFVADTGNNTIRKMTFTGTNWFVTTIAGSPIGSGTNDGVGSAARFNVPRGLAFDGSGDLYVADSNSHTIRRMTNNGSNWFVSTLAGVPLKSGFNGGTNNSAMFSGPRGVAFDSEGNLYVADQGNYRISKGIRIGGPVKPPAFSAVVEAGGLFQIQATNSASSQIILEVSSDLAQWQALLTNNGVLNYSEPVQGQTRRFFRAFSR